MTTVFFPSLPFLTWISGPLSVVTLVVPHVVQIAQIFCAEHTDGGLNIMDVVLQVVSHYLLPPPGQFVQIQQAHGPRCIRCVFVCVLSCPDRSADQDHNQQDASDDCYQRNTGVMFFAHFAISPCWASQISPSSV